MDSIIETAKSEWENIRTSLMKYADIGEFESALLDDSDMGEEELSEFNENLQDFPETVHDHGYTTLEAMGVYCVLVRIAANRLGMSGVVASAFANGYAYVRTGWALDTDTSIEQNLFYKMFFQSREDHTWKFDDPVIQIRLKEIFEKFLTWSQDQSYYQSEVQLYLEMKQDEAEEAD